MDSAVDQLIRGEVVNLQFDFHASNGQILLQVFRGSDVQNWSISLDVPRESVLIILHFSKNKTNNEARWARFVESEVFSLFEKFSDEDGVHFGLVVALDHDQVKSKIEQIFSQVYSAEELVDSYFTLNAY